MTTKKPLALFHIELYKREIVPKLYLAMYLAKNFNFQIYLGKVENYAQATIGKGIYLNKDHGVWSEERLLKIKANGYIVTAFDEEGMIYKSDEIYNRSRGSKKLLDELDGIFLWGENQARTIDKVSKNPSNKFKTGSPKFDFYKIVKKGSEAQGVAETTVIKVLINTRFTYVNSLNDCLQTDLGNLKKLGFVKTKADEDEFREFVESDSIIFEEFCELFNLLGNDERFSVVIRPHPAENGEVYKEFASKYKNILVDGDTDLIQQIVSHDCVIHDGCSTAIEARALGKHVFGLRPENLKSSYIATANSFSRNFLNASALKAYLLNKSEWCLEDVKKLGELYIENWADKDALSSFGKIIDSFDLEKVEILTPSNSEKNVKRFIGDVVYFFVRKFPFLLKFLPKGIAKKVQNFYQARSKSQKVFPEINLDNVNEQINYLCSLDEFLGSYVKYNIEKINSHSFVITYD